MNGKVEPAFSKVCADCPWRISNQGKKPDPGKWYTPANLKRLWNGLKRGADMSCHPTDTRMNYYPWRPVPEGAAAHECAGALTLKQREYQKFQAVCFANPDAKGLLSFKEYHQHNPNGMTLNGLRQVMEKFIFGGTPLGGVKMTRLDLGDAEIGYAPLSWTEEDKTAMRKEH